MRGVVAVLAVLLLAGCGGSTETDDVVVVESGRATAESGASLEAPKERGAIAGVVVDDAVFPVAGAVVRLPGIEVETTSDKDGAFRLDDLVPGPYFLEADAKGFAPASAVVEVRADEVRQVKVVLPRERSEDPYHRTQSFEGYADVAFDPITGIFTSYCSQCAWQVRLDAPADTLIVEGQRTSEQGPGAASYGQYDVTLWDSEGDAMVTDYPGDPFILRLDKDRVQNHTTLTLEVVPTGWYAPEVGVSFEVFVTSFHNGPAPEHWTFMGGSP